MMMRRRDFNKFLAALPLAGALPFSFIKKAEANIPKTKRDPRIFYPKEQVKIHGSTVNWEEPQFEISQMKVYENDVFEPKIMSVSVQTSFNLEQVFGLGQLSSEDPFMMGPPLIETEISVLYPELRVLADFSFESRCAAEWVKSETCGGLQRYYAASKVQVLQHGQCILQFDPHKVPSTRWDSQQPVEILIDYTDGNDPVCNLFIKEARLASISYSEGKEYLDGIDMS
jgi:hypothetical protein